MKKLGDYVCPLSALSRNQVLAMLPEKTGLEDFEEVLQDLSNLQPYGNSSGRSGVDSYAYGTKWVVVQFRDGSAYLYTEKSCGANRIAEMKQLADSGFGLNAFLTKVIRGGYAAKLKNGAIQSMGLEHFRDDTAFDIILMEYVEHELNTRK